MRLLRLFLISIVSLFLLVTAISLTVPSRVRISKAINIKAKPEIIWKQVDDMRQWKSWNPFFAKVDPESIRDADTTGGMINAMTLNGTRISWREKIAGSRIAAMERPDRNAVLNGWKCLEIPGSDSTTVQWYMDFQLRWYPWEKFASLMFERSYGPKMENGLSRLKEITEADRISYY